MEGFFRLRFVSADMLEGAQWDCGRADCGKKQREKTRQNSRRNICKGKKLSVERKQEFSQHCSILTANYPIISQHLTEKKVLIRVLEAKNVGKVLMLSLYSSYCCNPFYDAIGKLVHCR